MLGLTGTKNSLIFLHREKQLAEKKAGVVVDLLLSSINKTEEKQQQQERLFVKYAFVDLK